MATYKELLAANSQPLANGKTYFSAAAVCMSAVIADDTPQDIHQLVCWINEQEDVIKIAKERMAKGDLAGAQEILSGY